MMGLIRRLPRYHTTCEFRLAARQRHEEAKRSVMPMSPIFEGDRLLGVYLCGYAAEMFLKAAYFRLLGKKPTEPITVEEIREARSYAKKQHGMAWGGNLHDLSKWVELLTVERKARDRGYPVAFSRQLNVQVANLSENWSETLRYHINRPRPDEVTRVFQAVDWVFNNFARL